MVLEDGGPRGPDGYAPLPTSPTMPSTSPDGPRGRVKALTVLPGALALLLLVALFNPPDIGTLSWPSGNLSSEIGRLVSGQPVSPMAVAMSSAPAGVEQRPIEWKGEDIKLRNYRWGMHKPHTSLDRVIRRLDEVRDCHPSECGGAYVGSVCRMNEG